MATATANGQKKWWFIGPVLALAGVVFGAGGMAYTTRDSLAKHERCIEALTEKATNSQEVQGRLDERLKAIDASLARIEKKLEAKP